MSSCTKQLISATFILTPDFILEIAIFWIICRRLDEKLELQISNSFSCFILWYQGFFMKESYFYFIYFHKYLLLTSCIFINIRQCQLVNFSHLSFVFCTNTIFQYIFFFLREGNLFYDMGNQTAMSNISIVVYNEYFHASGAVTLWILLIWSYQLKTKISI